jgi:hypothetical protein
LFGTEIQRNTFKANNRVTSISISKMVRVFSQCIIRCVTSKRLIFLLTICSDGAHSTRYTPYSPNSGFYYVRHNDRTRYFFDVFMRMGDQIIGENYDMYINFMVLEFWKCYIYDKLTEVPLFLLLKSKPVARTNR